MYNISTPADFLLYKSFELFPVMEWYVLNTVNR